MTKTIDLNNWNYQEPLDSFRSFDDPYIGITTDTEITRAYTKAKEPALSFFLYYMSQSIMAANEVDKSQYRIIDDEVLGSPNIYRTTTIDREEGTFGIAFCETIEP
ncbi:MAG TPA: hypothetical protein VK112_12545 [Fodinibius sp.]|nr:hypothetical protein [Fodinibius sp.]